MKEKILLYLNQSKISIIVAVSWLTDSDIIKLITQKSKEGIKIKILLSASEWNMVRYNEFINLKNTGAIIHKRGAKEAGKGNFMHCKFAVVDEKILIQGSYNWTKLGNTNDENLEIIENYDKAREYVKDFHIKFKDSIDFFENMNDIDLDTIIKKYETMENENIEPPIEGEINPDKNITNSIIKIEESQKPSIIIPTLINKFENIQDYNFDGIKKIDFEGRLYISSFIYGPYDSTIKVSSNKKDNFNIRINNHALKEALIADNVDFSLLNSRMDGIPDFILKLLLQKRFVSIYSGIQLINKTPYKFDYPTKGEISFVLDKHDTFYNKDEYILIGNKLLKSINDGEKSKEDLNKEFIGINWL